MRISIDKLITSIQNIKVLPNTALDATLAIMSTSRISALPVVDETETLQGVITVYGIMQVWKASPMPLNNLIASTAMEQTHKMRPEPVAIDDDLYDHIDNFILSTHHSLYIINNRTERKALGKVSKVELMAYLATLGKPYILTKEIEEGLKKVIRRAYHDDNALNEAIANLSNSTKDNNGKALKLIKKLCADKGIVMPDNELESYARKVFPIKPNTRTLKDLTFSELMQLIQNPAAWAEIGQAFQPYDMPGWTKRVQPVLGARNDAFHFRKGIDQPLIDELNTYADWQEVCKIPERAEPAALLVELPHSEQEIAVGLSNFIQALEAGKPTNDSPMFSIDTIKGTISLSLPPEADTEVGWWTTDSSYTMQWTQKGWTVVDVDLPGQQITFAVDAQR
ncbi:CBS domain-containing protein [Hymenobacter aerophilus]|uniref:CBS domain-containing protein n=1 Tax=Hymenobacter aerophilus TaxID=119644 RepID=UPI00038060F8|nr:CBS domain-containing protein [Hymenobacter aerophilus]